MRTIFVVGNFGLEPKESSVGKKLAALFNADIINGGSFEDIQNVNLRGYNLIFWMPNIDNGFEKVYPKKDTGAVLICSKVLREGRTEIDAISRIFQIHGNAVIAIKSETTPFEFKLIDALGNAWVETSDLTQLHEAVISLVEWTLGAIRKNTSNIGSVEYDFTPYQRFIDINRKVADKFEVVNGRFFGNCSTRCSKMFPTMKVDATHMIVSKRNVSKQRLTTDDLVLVRLLGDGTLEYYGESKPSVDTPIQISLYKDFPSVNYMIHGHTYVEGAEFTDNYFPCGDMREYYETRLFINRPFGVINLINHGFFMYADTLDNLEEMVDKMVFMERNVGNEPVKK